MSNRSNQNFEQKWCNNEVKVMLHLEKELHNFSNNSALLDAQKLMRANCR